MVKFFGKISNGKKLYYRPSAYAEHLKTLESREFEEIIQERFVDTTKDEHAYYRSTNRWLIDNTEMFAGWEEDDVHELFQYMFLKYKKCVTLNPNNLALGATVEVTVIESTADIGKRRMAEFITKVQAWLSEQGILCPSPTEAILGKYATKIKKEKSSAKD